MKRPRQRSFLSFEKAASEAMPPVPPQMFPRISTISPIGGERSNAADAQAVRRQTTVTRAPRSRARLRVVTNSRDSWRSHVHRTYTAQRVQSFKP